MAIKVTSLKVGSIIRFNNPGKKKQSNPHAPRLVIRITKAGMNCMPLRGRGDGSPEIGVTATVHRFHDCDKIEDMHFCTKRELDIYFRVNSLQWAQGGSEEILTMHSNLVLNAVNALKKARKEARLAHRQVRQISRFFDQPPEKVISCLLRRYKRKLPYLPGKYSLD